MSPFTIKTKKLLLFKKIAYRQVHVSTLILLYRHPLDI